MNIVIIGAGISGLTAAHYLSKAGHQISVYEANDYVGGHTDTHLLGDNKTPVDSGFIVFNAANYPKFSHLIDELGIESQSSDMSFSVKNSASGLEYNADNLDTLFCQRSNLVKPRFYRMILDIFRFYRDSPILLEQAHNTESLAAYLSRNRYSQAFINDHIYPMACALWSSPTSEIKHFPARYLVQFMANHAMLQVSNRPIWRTIKGGSSSYVKALKNLFGEHIRINSPVRSVKRTDGAVFIKADNSDAEKFDKVFIACHSDQALALLDDASQHEQEILSAIPYQKNTMVLHSDASLLPKNRKAWASWNALVSDESEQQCTVSYYMNKLQSLSDATDYFVTLNPTVEINPETIHRTRTYHHPLYSIASTAAQKRRSEINGVNNTFYCGAYWGWGFHEDGVRSAVESVNLFKQSEPTHA